MRRGLVLLLLVGAAHADQRFAPVELRVSLDGLPAAERQVLAKLVTAGRVMDALFLRQVAPGNPAMLLALAERRAPELDDFLLYKGPWNRLDHDKVFVAGAPAKPPQANFYPLDATKAEIDAWWSKLPKPEAEAARGFFTVIR